MHFSRDCGVSDFMLLQNRHTYIHVHRPRAGAPARLILMCLKQTLFLRAALCLYLLPCMPVLQEQKQVTKKITIFRGALQVSRGLLIGDD
jgi:hypothetical protein